MKRLAIDQWILLVTQAVCAAAFVYVGRLADSAISASGETDAEVLDAVLGGLDDYQKWDQLAGVLLVVLAVMWLGGIARAVHRQAWQHLVLFAAAIPAFVTVAVLISKIT